MTADKEVPARVYVVLSATNGSKLALISANNKAHALAHHVEATLVVRVATQLEMHQAALDGIPVQDANAWRRQEAAQAATRG